MFEALLSFQLLTCSDYDFLVEGLSRTPISQSERIDFQLIFMEATDPQCFYTEDAND